MTAPSEQLSTELERAALNDTERRAIARIAEVLQAELGEDLLGLWLYGSRARGEADPSETHYDRRSDIDMMAIVDPRRDAAAFDLGLHPEADRAGRNGGRFTRLLLTSRPRRRPAARPPSDPLLLLPGGRSRQAGSRRRCPRWGRVQMSPRSEEFMGQARERLAIAHEVLASGHRSGAVSAACYAMLYAARAALSEHDEYARRHAGTWNLFRQRYVVTDAFDQDLFSLAHRAQEAREGADYEAIEPDPDRAKGYVEGAAAFVSAVEQMLAG